MKQRLAVGLVVLAAVVLLAPLAMAFVNCATMTAMCDGPCGVSSCAVPVPSDSTAPQLVADLSPESHDHLLTSRPTSIEHPPKPLRLSA